MMIANGVDFSFLWCYCLWYNVVIKSKLEFGAVAQSVAMPFGMQAVPRSIPASDTPS